MSAPITTEAWIRCPIAPDYEVSSKGRVRRLKPCNGSFAGRILTEEIGSNGYVRVGMSIDGVLKKKSVHRLVCEAFYGPVPSAKHHAAHGDGQKLNNVPENIRWATPAENIADIAKYGPPRAEERASHRKLNFASVAEIRSARRSYGFASRLAKKHGVSVSCVAAIRDPKRGLWPSVPYPETSSCQ